MIIYVNFIPIMGLTSAGFDIGSLLHIYYLKICLTFYKIKCCQNAVSTLRQHKFQISILVTHEFYKQQNKML